MKPILLLVDCQVDFLESPGLEPPGPEVARRAERLLSGARALGVPVAHVRTTVDPAADDRMPHWKALGRWRCVRGTAGCAAPPGLAEMPGERVVSKTFFSAFSSADLSAAIAAARADTLVLAGVHLHGCVRATALDAYERGLAVWVAEDAVGSDDPLHAAVTRRYLDGRAARFAPVEELLASLADGERAVISFEERLPAAIVSGRTIRRDDLPFLVHGSPRESGRALFSLPVADEAEISRAAAGARQAGEAWRREPAAHRARHLVRIAEALERSAPSLARRLAVDVGKPLTQGEAEVRRAAALFRHAAAAAPVDDLRAAGPGSAFRRVPVGVVAAITPWNNAIAIPAGKIAPALALGNSVVWKPAPAATRLAIALLELARDAGLAAGLVNLVAGDHRTACAVMNDPAVDAVSLSGSSLAGWAAQEVAARRRIPLQAELGGNNAAIVWAGADLRAAARGIAAGGFSFAGQRCTANRRAIVDATLYGAFLDALIGEVRALRWGDPLEPATEVGPLISETARDRVAAAIERARSTAEAIVVPHADDPAAGALSAAGAYLPPTLVAGAAPESEIAQEETFGPVLVLHRAADFEEALRLADGVRQGLVAALFAGPGPWRGRFLRAARAGVLKWDASTADADAGAPFGGWKASGVGPPEHGPGNAEFHTRLQALYGGP